MFRPRNLYKLNWKEIIEKTHNDNRHYLSGYENRLVNNAACSDFSNIIKQEKINIEDNTSIDRNNIILSDVVRTIIGKIDDFISHQLQKNCPSNKSIYFTSNQIEDYLIREYLDIIINKHMINLPKYTPFYIMKKMGVSMAYAPRIILNNIYGEFLAFNVSQQLKVGVFILKTIKKVVGMEVNNNTIQLLEVNYALKRIEELKKDLTPECYYMKDSTEIQNWIDRQDRKKLEKEL